jgi:signal transduction histidine kinase
MLLAAKEFDQESLEIIDEATQRCKTIVQKLMTYAKKPLEAIGVNEVNLLVVIKNVIDFLKFELEQENIKVVLNAHQDDYLIMGNDSELEQVVTNMILNAKDAIGKIRKEGKIEITLSQNDDRLKMEIKDEGIGIPKEIINRIFDPFFTTKEIGKGLGLGLSICHSVIEKYNGIITVQSEPDKGSIFTVKLPKIKESIVSKNG